MATQKIYEIIKCSDRNDTLTSGTIEQLVQKFSYTLLCGQSYQNEIGCSKINTQPKTISSLITNLNNAVKNSSANGCSKYWYKQGNKN